VLGVLFVVAAILLYGDVIQLPAACTNACAIACCGVGDAALSGPLDTSPDSTDTSLDTSVDTSLHMSPRMDDEKAGLLSVASRERRG
jgi:hypothetical protein